MHELAVAESLIDAVTERLPGTPISSVQVEIGTLSGVVPDALLFCFDLAAEGTTLEGATLEITEPAAKCECRSCGTAFEPDGPIAACPCGSADVAVLSGQEFTITSVKVA
ncbi:MAG TPA: hydrogenase maturation nickel metallochaperone HypA [Streptosporangiaceae bacterium]|nr:hydrogenase maturation nickel metallochaperone HypA [Streptosporangiaceae bacterium]